MPPRDRRRADIRPRGTRQGGETEAEPHRGAEKNQSRSPRSVPRIFHRALSSRATLTSLDLAQARISADSGCALPVAVRQDAPPTSVSGVHLSTWQSENPKLMAAVVPPTPPQPRKSLEGDQPKCWENLLVGSPGFTLRKPYRVGFWTMEGPWKPKHRESSFTFFILWQ